MSIDDGEKLLLDLSVVSWTTVRVHEAYATERGVFWSYIFCTSTAPNHLTMGHKRQELEWKCGAFQQSFVLFSRQQRFYFCSASNMCGYGG